MGISIDDKQKGFLSKNWGVILTIYIGLKPLYFKASGTLQISDMFLMVSFLLILLCTRGKIILSKNTRPMLSAMLVFVLFISIINGLWSTTGYNYSRYSLYYLFNFFAVLICSWVYSEIGSYRFKDSLLNGALFSVLVTSYGLITSINRIRGLGFFNNPNQLGYYGVVLISIAFFCRKMDRLKYIIVLAMGYWFIIVSLSKAAFISASIECILCSIVLEKGRSVKALIRKTVVILLLFGLVYLFLFTDVLFNTLGLSLLARMKTRLVHMVYENDTNLGSGRGYYRIKELGSNILFGMGEGNFTRFQVMRGAEVHSTYASIIVSYGIIGILLYINILIKAIFKRTKVFNNLAVVSGIMLYSLSHNGIRNTLVWILLSAISFTSVSLED